jgi:hypothetical protein
MYKQDRRSRATFRNSRKSLRRPHRCRVLAGKVLRQVFYRLAVADDAAKLVAICKNLSESFPSIDGPSSTFIANHSIMASSTMGHRQSWQVNSISEQLHLRHCSCVVFHCHIPKFSFQNVNQFSHKELKFFKRIHLF